MIPVEDLLEEIKMLKSKSAFEELPGKNIFIERQTKRVLDLCFPFLLDRIEKLCFDLSSNYLNIKIDPAADMVGGLIAKDSSDYEWERYLVFYKKNQQVKSLNLYVIRVLEQEENKYYIINKI